MKIDRLKKIEKRVEGMLIENRLSELRDTMRTLETVETYLRESQRNQVDSGKGTQGIWGTTSRPPLRVWM